MMKKVFALFVCLVLMMSLNMGFAETESLEDWSAYVYAYRIDTPIIAGIVIDHPQRTYRQYVLEWKSEMVNTNFPQEVLRSHIRECERWNGEPIGALGLEPTGGSKLRSTPDFSSSANIVGAISANKTIYIYFKVTNQYGKDWYYIVTDRGIEGFVAASRIQVVWI